ncbi:hypothetical protein RFI_02943 [Reticulomyxa filosa]|uniref:Uncharacterized protein n=1 Tax=Reticulomyxa filosa TaxID=46433 RepID=X6P7H4_RETFI|nr:hypothetical protein RFI_02943 [Reticulomyxa filosa]|eukprot:ETO34151.1 hypothetical protein RFI_02943 [Reticulomyxa filosa]
MTNQEWFEYYKEHHRESSQLSMSLPNLLSPNNSNTKYTNDELLGTIEEHKTVDEKDALNNDNGEQTNLELSQKIQTVLKEEIVAVKDTIRHEFQLVGNDFIQNFKSLATNVSIGSLVLFLFYIASFATPQRRRQLITILAGPFAWLFRATSRNKTKGPKTPFCNLILRPDFGLKSSYI